VIISPLSRRAFKMNEDFSTGEFSCEPPVPCSVFINFSRFDFYSDCSDASMPTLMGVDNDDSNGGGEGDSDDESVKQKGKKGTGVQALFTGVDSSEADREYCGEESSVDVSKDDDDYRIEDTNKDNEDDENDNSVIELPPIKKMWECEMIRKYEEGGLLMWKCEWCQQEFKGWNHTKVIDHIAKRRGHDIRICTRKKLPQEYKNRYRPFVAGRLQKARETRDEKRNLQAKLVEQRKKSRNNKQTAKQISVASSKKSFLSSPSTKTVDTISTRNSFVQTKIEESPNPEAELHLSRAIADMIHSLGLSFSFASEFKFRNVLRLAKTVPSKYSPPSRNQVAGVLLDQNYMSYCNELEEKLMIEAEVFGLTFYGDGATVRKMPLFNILAAGVHCPAAVLEIVDCSQQMSSGGKKDSQYISSLFLTHMNKLDKEKSLTDLIYFDGASNVQKAGRILSNHFPRVSSLHAAEHVVSLFFSDICKFPEIQALIKVGCHISLFHFCPHLPNLTFQVFFETNSSIARHTVILEVVACILCMHVLCDIRRHIIKENRLD